MPHFTSGIQVGQINKIKSQFACGSDAWHKYYDNDMKGIDVVTE